METRYGSPHHQGTPPGRRDVHRFGNSRTVRRQWLIAGVLTVAVVAVIGVLVFGLRMVAVLCGLRRGIVPRGRRWLIDSFFRHAVAVVTYRGTFHRERVKGVDAATTPHELTTVHRMDERSISSPGNA